MLKIIRWLRMSCTYSWSGTVRTTSDQKLSRSSSDSSTCLRLVMSLMLRITAS
ncbi:hypothetical protein D3C77_788450 [compost metagenome]